jgi:hypothetical protein
MLARIIGVFKLDSKTFEEIEHNVSLTLPAALIVVLVSLVMGLGVGASNAIFSRSFGGGFIRTLIGGIIGWLIWSVVTWLVGTKLFKGQANLGEMLRVIGFALLPLLFTIIPCIGMVIGIIWAIAAGFIAVRQGLDLDNTKTFFTVVLGGFCYAVLMAILNVLI